MDKKIIAIVGATGAQGGGLARAILSDSNSQFAVRALTRKPGSDAAKELASLGAEIVQADIDSVESITKALDGAYGAFFVTAFWEHFSPDVEKKHARNMAEAAKAAGVKHAIWSSLEDTRTLLPVDNDIMPTLMDEYNVPHFDAKGEANAYFAEYGVPTTILNTSFYWDNFIYFGTGPQRGEDGSLALVLPMEDKRLPGIAAEDIGKVAYGIFKDGDTYINKTVSVAGEHLTGEEMAAGMTEALGEKVTYVPVPHDVYRSFGFPGAEDMGNMFHFKVAFEEQYVGARDLEVARTLNPDLLSYKEWIARYGKNIPVPERV
jgi:uncharacterized protein YbjT (DUF2867 family)